MSTPGAASPLPHQFLPDYDSETPREQLRRIQENFDAQALAVGRTSTVGLATPTFQNSWGNLGGVYQTAALWKQGDGTVHLTGVITKAGVYAAEVLLTVPVGYRPALGEVLASAYTSSTPTYGHTRLELANTGNLSLVAGTLGAVAIGHISVCGLTWKAAA